jgi:hypothetical protein
MYDPSKESYALRSKTHRYIRYENGREEFYDTRKDPHEWTNVASDPNYATELAEYRQRLTLRIPGPGAKTPKQPPFKPKQPTNGQANEKSAQQKASGKSVSGDAEVWKNLYFSKHPEADSDRDGKLTWPEYKSYRAKFDPPPAGR